MPKKNQAVSAELTEKIVPDRLVTAPSLKPGLGLMERIAHSLRPSKQDLAIRDAWAFRYPVTIVPTGTLND